MSEAHFAAYGAMLVISLPALGKTIVVVCEGQGTAHPARPITAKPPVDLDANPPVTLADLFSILDGEWLWLMCIFAMTNAHMHNFYYIIRV